MARQSIESMYDLMFSMRSKMEDILQDAQELTAAAKTYGGEISRVMVEQMTRYFAPTIKKLIDDEKTPGSMVGVIRFLDSVPLSYTRIEPSMDEIIAPETPTHPDLREPAGTTEIDNIPNRASFANPEGVEEAPIQAPAVEPVAESVEVERSVLQEEKNKIEGIKVYSIVRSSNMGSHLGDDIANIEDHIVGDFNTEEEANAKCEALNNSLTAAEKDLFGTEYSVKERFLPSL